MDVGEMKLYNSAVKEMHCFGEVVMAQLTARSLPIPENPASNPIIGKFYWPGLHSIVGRKDENKEIEAVNGPFLKRDTARLDAVTITFVQCFTIIPQGYVIGRRVKAAIYL